MLLCHFKFSFKEDKLNFRFIGTLKVGVLPIWIVVKSHVSSVGPSSEKNIKTFYDCIGGCKETKRIKTTLYNKTNAIFSNEMTVFQLRLWVIFVKIIFTTYIFLSSENNHFNS